MRAAVVGAGRIGSFHARNLAKTEDIDDVVIVDANETAARTLGDSLRDTLGVTTSTSIDVARTLGAGVDLVVVAAPTSLHTQLTLECVEAGVPVFCEKPGATSLAEATQLVDAVAASGVSVQIGFQRRFDPPIRAAAIARAGGEVGHVYLVRSATHDHEPPDITYAPPRETLFTETLIHDFDAIRYVTGQEVTRVMAMSHAPGPADLDGFVGDVRHAGVLLQLDGGAQAVATAAWHDPCGYDVRMELLGSRDSIAVGYGDRPQIRRLDMAEADDPAPRTYGGFIERFEVAYRDELEGFVDCVRAGSRPEVGVRDAHAALAIAFAAWDSQQEGRPVDLGASGVPA